MEYTIGLDIGVTSIGWAVINNEKKRIENLGVRIFDAAENPKDGSSLAVPRRLARSTRRRLRRRKHRLERIRRLYLKYRLLDEVSLENLFMNLVNYDPYELRNKALFERISDADLARILLHISKRRGFKSNRKSELQEKDMGVLLSSIEQNRKIIEEREITPGQLLNELEIKRNKRGEYKNTLLRSNLIDEISKIFEKQREFGNDKLTEEFEREFIEIFSSQRSFAKPGAIEDLTGKCTFEKTELRAPSAAYTSEIFMVLTKANSIVIQNQEGERKLNREEIRLIKDEALKKKKVTFSSLRNVLQLEEGDIFNFLDYNSKNKAGELLSREEIEKSPFIELKHYHKLRDTIVKDLGEVTWLKLLENPLSIDTIAYALTFRKSDEDIRNYFFGIENYGKNVIRPEVDIHPEIVECVLKLSFSRTKNLSLKAMNKMIPYLMEGFRYDEAASKAGYHHSVRNTKEKHIVLPVLEIEEIKNPVVFRALSQCRKVINSIIRVYGSPYRIHIELARDLSKSFTDRKEIEKKQKENLAEKERAANHFQELYHQVPKSSDILKWRLLKEQDGKCAYSLKTIDPYRLTESGYTEIDHILPYSRTFDNSYFNKVLVLTDENRDKLNRTPYEYFGHDNDRWHRFETWVNAAKLPRDKKQKLLRMQLKRDQGMEMKDRALNDTRYISRYLKNYLEDNLLFAEGPQKKRVFTYKGQMTAYLRHRWGFEAKDRSNDLHHALDAVLVGVMNDGMVQEIERASKRREFYKRKIEREYVDPETGEIVEELCMKINNTKLNEPWVDFRQEVEIRLSENPQYGLKHKKFYNYDPEEIELIKPIFVSRMPFRKITGHAHMETIRGAKYLDKNIKTSKEVLSNITLEKLEKMIGKETDRLTYNLIKERLLQHNNKPQEAFKEPLYKLKKDGSNGPEIKSIKIGETYSAGVSINDGTGVADNGKMIRVDIFKKQGKHYAIPVYVHHIVNGALPNKVINPGRPFSEWKELDDTYEFLFSLHKNDLIKLQFKNGEEIFGYYIMIDSSVASVTIENDARSEKYRKSIMTCKEIQKWSVDVLGNISQIKKEQRRELEKPRHFKQGSAFN